MNFALKKLLWVQMDKNITLSSCVYEEFSENASRVLKTFMLSGFYSNLSVFVVRSKYCSPTGNTSRWEKSGKNRP